MKRLKWLTFSFVLIFSLPLVLQYLPQSKQPQPDTQLVYASQPQLTKKDVLVFFTHSHEAYEPIVKKATGTKAYYDETANIEALATPITNAFGEQKLAVHTIETDLMATMKLSNSKFHQAYAVARPFIEQALSSRSYDLILDIHRDSAGKATTTLKNDQGSFAKIAIVVGMEHPMHAWNLAYAEQLNAQLNTLVPGISRGIMKKEGKGVDGVYNQDLAQQMLLLEIGGIGNTEEELVQTINILSQAVQKLLADSEAVM